jgi:hypothetical protein
MKCPLAAPPFPGAAFVDWGRIRFRKLLSLRPCPTEAKVALRQGILGRVRWWQGVKAS